MEKSLLLPLKKRRGTSSGADDSLVVPPKKRLQFSSTGLQLEQTARSDATTSAAYGITVETHRHDDTATAANTSSTQQPPQQQQKLLHVGVRSGDETPAAQAKKKTKTNRNRDKRPAREAVPLPSATVDRTLRLGAELTRRLEELGVGATAPPRFVCMKTLQLSDVSKNQNRLLISCKPECLEGHAITDLFAGNPKETYLVHECEAGLRVGVLDGHGAEFRIRLRYLESNGGYRFITGWSAFVEANGLDEAVAQGRHVEVELWAFRSPKLPGQPVLKDKDEQRLIDSLEGHPDGALGLLFLPYFDRAEEEGPRPPAPVRETKRQASAKVVRQEKKRKTKKKATATADHVHVRGNRPGKAAAREMTLDEVVTAAGPQLADSLIGLLMLSSTSRCSPVPTARSNGYAGVASFQQVAATHKE